MTFKSSHSVFIMDDKSGSDKPPIINEYFKDSNSDIFDQISSKLNTTSSVSSSVDDCTNNSSHSSNISKVNDNTKGPVICRIFSDSGENGNKSSDKLFFDMLSSSTKSSVNIAEKQTLSTNSSNIFNTLDFANHGNLLFIRFIIHEFMYFVVMK